MQDARGETKKVSVDFMRENPSVSRKNLFSILLHVVVLNKDNYLVYLNLRVKVVVY